MLGCQGSRKASYSGRTVMDPALLVIFAIPLEDYLLVRVVQGLKLSRGRRNAAAEAPIMRAFLLADEKSLEIKCELPQVQESRSDGESRDGVCVF